MTEPFYHSTLRIINSKMDLNGNRYWCFEFIDHKSGLEFTGKISGGESNIDFIRYGWSTPKAYDRGFIVERIELPIREYNKRTKEYQYAGCSHTELQSFIRSRLVCDM